MNVDTNTMLSITDANHNFSKVTKVVDKYGSALILKSNEPKYMILDLANVDEKALEAIMKKLVKGGKKAGK